MKATLLILIFMLSCSSNYGENDNINSSSIPKPKTIKELKRDSIKIACYTNQFILTDKNWEGDTYRSARIQMYREIFNTSDTIIGVYSGYKREYNYDRDNSNPDPINCEHTVPQSFFNKKEPMRSDLHHLFPVHKDINEKRSYYKFAEIDDHTTENWMINGQILGSEIPLNNLSKYSEYHNNLFEPPEDHKGNVARAVFYFFTMYPEITGSTGIKNTITSVSSIEILKAWHISDPVDDLERSRNNLIEAYQGNRNPYIDDASLIDKVW